MLSNAIFIFTPRFFDYSLFRSGFPIKILYAFLIFHACYILSHLILLDFVTVTMFGEAHKL